MMEGKGDLLMRGCAIKWFCERAKKGWEFRSDYRLHRAPLDLAYALSGDDWGASTSGGVCCQQGGVLDGLIPIDCCCSVIKDS